VSFCSVPKLILDAENWAVSWQICQLDGLPRPSLLPTLLAKNPGYTQNPGRVLSAIADFTH